MTEAGNGNIAEITPGGVLTTFASGLNEPYGLTVNSSGDLFEVSPESGTILEFTPGRVESNFASGAGEPWGLAFNSNGNLFASSGNLDYGTIYEYSPSGQESTYANGITDAYALAFAPMSSNPVPEPAFYQMSVFLVMGGIGLVRLRRKRAAADANA